MTSPVLCKICNKEKFKYSCPKCNILYCSLGCYKSPQHTNCSDQFYKKCVEDEISATSQSSGDIKKMYDILNRFNAEFTEDELNDQVPTEQLDSDDENDEAEEDAMAIRLKGIDINDSDKIWNHLTVTERQDFEAMIENGEIIKLLPKYSPWWSVNSSKLVVPISEVTTPDICENIPPFHTIYSKEAPPCIHNNLWNIIAAYVSTVKFFNGEHHTNPWEATSYFILLSANLKQNINFDDAEQALISVQMEALAQSVELPCDDFKEVQKDVRQIMSTLSYQMAALSDTLRLFKNAKDQHFSRKNLKQTKCEFTQRFEGQISSNFSKSKLNCLMKKIEFLLSFVNKDLQTIV